MGRRGRNGVQACRWVSRQLGERAEVVAAHSDSDSDSEEREAEAKGGGGGGGEGGEGSKVVIGQQGR